ncbi:hypothetical protein AVJ23_14675 [Pseudoponticoccus marisrubri]|uniref:Uncharacterized protein n=1 Tax=Pseudoponticoccus marisrubri TaxID=1685382 RepID=A0A0W7WH85_9RHOB|nr:hypothetical protein AVJ23_14675 [Pseudoponticoccus marisrubri]
MAAAPRGSVSEAILESKASCHACRQGWRKKRRGGGVKGFAVEFMAMVALGAIGDELTLA